MKTKTALLLELWQEARTRFSIQLQNLTEADLTMKLSPAPNKVRFLIRHIGEVELLFTKNVFGESAVKVSAKTVIEKRDMGKWSNLSELKQYVINSFEALTAIVENKPMKIGKRASQHRNLVQKPKHLAK